MEKRTTVKELLETGKELKIEKFVPYMSCKKLMITDFRADKAESELWLEHQPVLDKEISFYGKQVEWEAYTEEYEGGWIDEETEVEDVHEENGVICAKTYYYPPSEAMTNDCEGCRWEEVCREIESNARYLPKEK